MKIRPYARVVVEGMDGAGKTTLVNQLESFLGDYGHFVPGYNRVVGEKSPMSQWWMEQLAENPVGRVIIHDRFFYPELVYGPVLRNKIDTDGSTQFYVQNFLRQYAFLIYCRPPIAVLREGAQVEKQMEGVYDRFTELTVEYDKLMITEAEAMDGRFIKYDWTENNAILKLLRRLTGYIYI